MKLPNRHRTHQLEAESVRKFQSHLPPTWVYRTPSDDYGIDGEVEIFDRKGFATGLKFLVQLKATDEKDINKALKLRLPVKKANYFGKLNVPVLVVRYLAAGKKLYVRWFHSFDPYWESKTANSLAFNFSDNNAWQPESEDQIVNELKEYVSLNVNKNPFPISLPIVFAENCFLGDNTAKFVNKVIAVEKKYSDLFDFRFGKSNRTMPPNYILFDRDKLHIVFACRTGACFHLKKNDEGKNTDNVLNDFFVGIGLALFSHGFFTQAGRLLSENILSSTFKRNEKIISKTIFCLIHSSKIEQYLIIIKELFSDDKCVDIAQVALAKITECSHSLNENDINIVCNYYNIIRDSLVERGICDIAAAIEYNHVNLIGSRSDRYTDSIKHYNNAAKLNCDYKMRPYWLSEVAGRLFLLERYYFSSLYYKASLKIEYCSHVQGLYADSLMYSGRFRESLDEFHRYFESVSENESNSEWRLKSLCLHEIVDSLGVSSQPSSFSSGNTNTLAKNDDDSLMNYLKNNDALCGEAYFLLGKSHISKEKYNTAMIFFLLSAFTGHLDMASFANAISSALQDENLGMATTILECAYGKFENDFILYFTESWPLHEGNDPVQAQLTIVDLMQMLNETKTKNRSMEVRLHGPGEGYEKIILGGANKTKK